MSTKTLGKEKLAGFDQSRILIEPNPRNLRMINLNSRSLKSFNSQNVN